MKKVEKERQREAKIPLIDEWAVTEVMDRLKCMLTETEPSELKIVLGHMIEKIVVEDDHLEIHYTFPQSTIMPVTGDPCGIRTRDLHRDRVACLTATPRGLEDK